MCLRGDVAASEDPEKELLKAAAAPVEMRPRMAGVTSAVWVTSRGTIVIGTPLEKTIAAASGST